MFSTEIKLVFGFDIWTILGSKLRPVNRKCPVKETIFPVNSLDGGTFCSIIYKFKEESNR